MKLTDKNRLSITHPELCKEWDYEKNGDLRPEDVSCGSGKEVGWICRKNHKWDTSIAARASKGRNCPYCANQRVSKDNCLATVYPELCKEWDYEENYPLTPENVVWCSRKKVSWICGKNRHSYKMRICLRTSTKKSSCPYCSHHRTSDENRLSILYPGLCKEWDYEKNYPLRPEDVGYASNKEVSWICSICKQGWKAAVASRTSRKYGCPYCSGRRISDKNRLSVTHPHLCKEWDYEKNYPLKPDDVSYGSGKKVGWICKDCKRSWEAIVSSRTQENGENGAGCPYCSGRKVTDKNKLSIIHPELCREWDYEMNGDLKPEDVSFGSGQKVNWKCEKCGYRWAATVAHRSSGCGCSVCHNSNGRPIVNDQNNLMVINPELCKEWNYKKNNGLTPDKIVFCSQKVVYWECPKCGYEWKWSIEKRNKNKNVGRCKRCSLLAIKCPELVSEWHPTKNGELTPFDVTFGSHIKATWKCKTCGYVWKAAISKRVNGSKCPLCDKIILKDGFTCASFAEAYYYLKLKSRKIKFIYDKKYDKKYGRKNNKRFDFYIYKFQTYVEVTGYSKEQLKTKPGRWFNYLRNIVEKRRYVREILNKDFRFILIKLNKYQIAYVRKNMVQNNLK